MNAVNLKICIAEQEDFSPSILTDIKTRYELVAMQPNENLKDILNRVDIFWFRLGYKIDGEVIDEKTKCRFLVSPVTGLDHIDESLCKKYDIKIISLRGEFEFLKTIRATAEHTIALTLALYRNVPDAIIHTRKGEWDRDSFRGRELFNKKVGIIGFGRLGSIVAGYFKAFGCIVGYYDIANKESEEFIKYDSMDSLLRESEIVSIHVNYHQENHHFFTRTHFNKMKNNAILINTSRGGLVDEHALLEALEDMSISGAALDVLHGEPKIANKELIKFSRNHSNLIITPHIGGNTFESFEKTELFIFKKLMKLIDG